ncbi:MAG: response regulator [Deltaproteobacteria bacterium]|nr:response regulator [Deltaproteobacteria bacterium]
MANENWKVLIIDDEEGIRKVLSITLTDAGYHVLTAGEGEAGIQAFVAESPQIVITDIRMPGMDGIEVLQQIKAADPKAEVIVVTGFGEIDLAVRALQLDASDFITKPIHDDALFIALERAKHHFSTRKELEDYTKLIEERWMDTAEELARTFHFQNNLIESSIDGILGCDEEGSVIVFNKSIETMSGYSKAEVRKQMCFDQFLPVGMAKKFREDLASEEYGGAHRLFLYETHLLTKQGDQVPVQVSATALFEEKREAGMVAFFRDLRELRRLEQQFADQTRLLLQDKMISLGRLAASVVHEINNPLAGILNYVRLMIKTLRKGALDAEHLKKFQGYLDLVESETGRCSKIVSNLLAFSRQSKLEFAEVDLNDLMNKCVLLSQHKLDLQNIRVTTRLQTDLPKIWGDYNQIQQCVINLIFNAVDAMPEGGTLILCNSLDVRNRLVEIHVEDTGHGISPQDLPHIFEPFFTTKTVGKGLGLGLSTVYGIIDRHHGAITARSEPGKGSVFTIKLPLSNTRK